MQYTRRLYTVWLSWKLKHNYRVIVRHTPATICHRCSTQLCSTEWLFSISEILSSSFWPYMTLCPKYASDCAEVCYIPERGLSKIASTHPTILTSCILKTRNAINVLLAKEMSNARPDGLTPWLHSHWPWPATKAHSLVDVKREYFIPWPSWCRTRLNR